MVSCYVLNPPSRYPNLMTLVHPQPSELTSPGLAPYRKFRKGRSLESTYKAIITQSQSLPRKAFKA